MSEQKRTIGILGTGDFARALAKRLFLSGYDVIIGSRRPEEKSLSAMDEGLCGMRVVNTEECMKSVSIIILAVHVEHFRNLLEGYTELLDGKVVVDVSNRDKASDTNSNAEYLQALIPSAYVVKAFNVISAYAMENNYNTSSRQVFIAGNNDIARGTVSNVARAMNFTPVDFGSLLAARRIERHPLLLFTGWGGPCLFTMTVCILWLLYLIYIYFIEKTVYEWEQIFVKVLNKAICMTGITVLSVTYLASSFATIFQLYYGTKHIRFPRWLDKWLRNRKQLGLISFVLIAIHAIMSTLIMSPTYLRSWYHSTKISISFNTTQGYEFQNINWMTWKGEAACLTGIVSFTLLCFVCVSTFPSVTDTLNWREWRFVQSKLGHMALLVAVVHVSVMGIPGWAKNPRKIYKSITFLSSIVPWITIFLKMLFSIPCVERYITNIRKGWERGNTRCKSKCVHPKNDGYVIVNGDRTKVNVSGDCLCSGDTLQMVKCDGTSCVCTDVEQV